MKLSHIDNKGNARMVDISDKNITQREAIARGRIKMKASTLDLIIEGGLPKGDVIPTARIAGIMATKHTHELIPMCHNIPIDSVKIEFEFNTEESCINIKSIVRCNWKTGAEMEALTAASVAALTIYDMCKAVDKDMEIEGITLLEKRGGKSGEYIKQF